MIGDVPNTIPTDNHFLSDLKANVIHFWHLGTTFRLLFAQNPLDDSIFGCSESDQKGTVQSIVEAHYTISASDYRYYKFKNQTVVTIEVASEFLNFR